MVYPQIPPIHTDEKTELAELVACLESVDQIFLRPAAAAATGCRTTG
jgi:hypothetical protein